MNFEEKAKFLLINFDVYYNEKNVDIAKKHIQQAYTQGIEDERKKSAALVNVLEKFTQPYTSNNKMKEARQALATYREDRLEEQGE